jgi:chromate reductase
VNTCRLLLISGSLRSGSTNSAVVRTARAVAPDGVAATVYDGLGRLPHFNPDDDTEPLHPAIADLRGQISTAGGLLFSVPEYAGGLPGSFKNLLDWTIGDGGSGAIYRKPVAWINASARGAADAHESLRKVLGYAHADVVEAACAHIPVSAAMIGEDGLVAEPEARERIGRALAELAKHVRTGP